ncbi:F-box/LRR-repeat protein At4g14096-like [Apium graveolens]|uniref:F-box/LRR-repeat protein At4g14096-like n=1 Tax=Apium graveolens TaxID=4045 RepID=UPI003D7A1235
MFLTTASVDVALRLERSMESRAYSDIMFGLLNKIYHVKYLTLSENTLRVLTHASVYCFPTFHNLTVLELLFDTPSCWTLLRHILARSPNLQSLVFPNGLVGMSSSGSSFSWSPSELVPECLFSHLKIIEIREILGNNEELLLLKYLLEYGRSLRRISIDVPKYAKIRKELVKLRRGSKTCKLDLIF